jgi:hypothetical protein
LSIATPAAAASAERGLVLCDIRHPQRLRMPDQLAEQPHPGRIRPDRLDLGLAQPDGDEPLQVLPAAVDDAEGPVARGDQLGRRLDDRGQHLVQLQAAGHRQHALQQLLDPVAGGPDLRHAGDQLVEQLVHAQLWEQRIPRRARLPLGHPRAAFPDGAPPMAGTGG